MVDDTWLDYDAIEAEWLVYCSGHGKTLLVARVQSWIRADRVCEYLAAGYIGTAIGELWGKRRPYG